MQVMIEVGTYVMRGVVPLISNHLAAHPAAVAIPRNIGKTGARHHSEAGRPPVPMFLGIQEPPNTNRACADVHCFFS